MHRHGYKGRKFGREKDQRQALLRGLMCSLILNHSIKTTLARAKETRRHTEKLVTLAKKNTLASRRLLIARLDNMEVADHLISVVVPSLKRDSGYLRIVRSGFRKGDNTEMATISFVDEIALTTPAKPAKEEKKTAKPSSTKASAPKETK